MVIVEVPEVPGVAMVTGVPVIEKDGVALAGTTVIATFVDCVSLP
jgi:hypothetical protein